MRGIGRVSIFTFPILFCTAPAFAHIFSVTRVSAVLKGDGVFVIDMRIDVDALALGVSSAVPHAEVAASLRSLSAEERNRATQRARRTIQRRVRVRFDGRKVIPDVTFPDRDRKTINPDAKTSVLGGTARLRGTFPGEARTFTFGASRAFNAIQLTIADEVHARSAKHVLGAGEDSPPFLLHGITIDNTGAVVGRYVLLGFEHILPEGLDHILFVLALYLLSVRLRPLLLQISAFTVAHSITLALSMGGVASLPSRIVEPLIAVSIAYVAMENVCVSNLKPWRPLVVFVFGLLHGMGFARVLRELGMPDGQFVSALVGFNVGVEFGQLAVVGLAFLALGWFRHRPWYRKRIVRPLSLGIALIGIFWAVERFFFTP